MDRSSSALWIALWALLLVPASSEAQSSSPLTLFIQAGVLDPAGDLPNAPILEDAGTVLTFNDLPTQPALGVALSLNADALPVDLRLRAMRSLSGSSVGRWGCAPQPGGEPTPCPDILIEVETEVTTWVTSLDAGLRLQAGRAAVQPRVGVSYVRHAYRWPVAPAGSFSLETGRFADGSFGLDLGAALLLTVADSDITLEYVTVIGSESATRPMRLGSILLGVGVPIG